MAIGKVRCLTELETGILNRNGVDPSHCSVVHRDETCIVLINHRTRDNIVIHQGERTWEKE